jgi:tetratricopeptide (TPR) repeat protein
MSSPPLNGAEREERLNAILAAWLEAAEAGTAPDPQEFVARYPEFAPELTRHLANWQLFPRLPGPADDALQATPPQTTARTATFHPAAEIADGPAEQAGSFGDYELLQELGRGGMGVVHQARDRKLQRLVALKVLLAGPFATPADRQRFRNETEMVASLDHQYIVPIYEVGELGRQPYFSMKFLEGGSLAAYLEGHRLDSQAAARMMFRLAEAVHYAHQRGILHRDLKPANVLLDGIGRPHLSDFGLARWLAEEKGVSGSGTILGTPSYMAPEQASGQRSRVTTAADVYGLGAILYHLLTGRPPFRGDTPLETLQLVQHGRPERPRTLNPQLDPGLEAICLKCLEPEPSRRYGSAELVAKDLGCWLAGEPIEARPMGSAEQLWRWCRRNPAVAGLAAALAFALLAGVAGVTWKWRQAEANAAIARHHERTAEANAASALRNLQAAEAARTEADANYQKANHAVEQMLTRVGAKHLAHVPGMTRVRRALLQDALHYYQGVLQQKSTDPAVRQETARAYAKVGQISRQLGEHAQAEEAFRQGIALQEQLVADFPDRAAYRHELGGGLINWALVCQETGRHAQAEQLYRRAQGLFEKLAAEFPGVEGHRYELSATLHNLAALLEETNRPQEAETAYRQALALREKLAADLPSVPYFRSELGNTYHDLGGLLETLRRPKEAEALWQKAVGLHEKLVAEFGDVPSYRQQLAKDYMALGLLYKQTERYGESGPLYEKALALRSKLVDSFPDVPAYRQELAYAQDGLGQLRLCTFQWAESEKAQRTALAIRQKLAADFPTVPDYQSELAAAFHNLAIVRCAQGAREEACQLYEQAISHEQAALKQNPRNPTYRRYLRNHYWLLADTLVERKQHGPAAQAAAELPRVFPDGWEEYHRAAGLLARCVPLAEKDAGLPEAKRTETARAYADQAIAQLRQAVRKGFADGQALEREATFAPLRSREEFQQVVRELRREKK